MDELDDFCPSGPKTSTFVHACEVDPCQHTPCPTAVRLSDREPDGGEPDPDPDDEPNCEAAGAGNGEPGYG